MERFKDLISKKFALFFLGIYIVLYYLIYSIGQQFSDYQIPALKIIILLGEGVPILILIYNIFHRKIQSKWIWISFLLGIIFYTIGDFIWLLYATMWGIQLLVPSICDVFFIIAAGLFLVAIQNFLKIEKLYFFIRSQFDMLIVMVVATTFIYKYLLLSIWNDEVMSLEAKVVSLIYPVTDIAYLAGVLIIVFSNDIQLLKKRAPLFLIISFITLFVADMLSMSLGSRGFIWTEPLWPIAFMSVSIASFYGNDLLIDSKHRAIKNTGYIKILNYLKLLFPYIAASGIIILASCKEIFNDVLVTGAVIATLLIMIRQVFVMIENDKLLNILNESNLLLKDEKEQKELEASQDYLTKLYNRRYLTQAIDRYIDEFDSNEIIDFCIFLIDVDHYKVFNDVYGHTLGDKVLIEIANVIKDNIRANDIAGRYGGDEFIIFLPDITRDRAEVIANRLIKLVNAKSFAEGTEIQITLSIGNLYWKDTREKYDLTSIIREVDHILYEAKDSGRNKVVSK